MTAEMSPVELLRAAAEVARTVPFFRDWREGPIGEPLAAWFEVEMLRVDRAMSGGYPVSLELINEYHAASLRVARVLLGVPDGR